MLAQHLRRIAICLALTLFVRIAHASVVPLSGFLMVKGGISFNIGLRSGGTVWTWGDNSVGQLGNGNTNPSLTPTQVLCGDAAGDPDHCSADGYLKGAVSVAAGFAAAAVLLDNGTVLAWGNNSRFNNAAQAITPVYAACGAADAAHCSGGVLTGVVQIGVGFSHYLVLLDDGAVLAWGTNNNGNLGNNQPAVPSATPVQVSGLTSGSGVTAISVGINYSFALKTGGTVVGWGANVGQLGDNTIVPKSTPVPVLCRAGDATGSAFCSSGGVLQGVVTISAGNALSFALMNDQTLLGWGTNAIGQVGDGTIATRRTPTNVCAVGSTGTCSIASGNVLQGVAAIGGGSLSSTGYAVLPTGVLLAWGTNSNGQIGDGTTMSRARPVGIASGVIGVSAGDAHAIALKADGTLMAWGSNTSGQLGNGTISATPTPVAVAGLGSGSGVIAIASRQQFTLALRSNGTVLAWGANGNGQLGDGTLTNRNIPVPVVCRTGDAPGSTFCSGDGHLQGVSAISAGNSSYALALLNDGTVVGWGTNANGALGDGLAAQRNVPASVCAVGAAAPCTAANGNILQGIVGIAAAGMSSFALTSAGTMLAWGANGNGFLGDGTFTPRPTPGFVRCRAGDALGSAFCSSAGFLEGVARIAAAASGVFAIMIDGTVLAWGLNLVNQLGDGTALNRNLPVNVCAAGTTAPCTVANGNVLQGISAVAGAANGAFGLTTGGVMVAWGANNAGTLGDGTTTTGPVPVYVCAMVAVAPCTAANGNNLQAVSTIGAGMTTGYAVLSDGSVVGWGSNSSGQIGDGTLISRLTPTLVFGLHFGSDVVAISGGSASTVALKADGTVLAWGANGVGELGNGVTYPANLVPSHVLFDDVTPPTLTFGSATPPDGANGWYVTDVSIPWTGADAHSALDGTVNPTSPLVLSAEGAAINGSVTLCDIAGNCDTFSSAAFKIDKTAPQVTVSASPDLLWPPDRRPVQVRLSVAATDNLGLPAQPITGLTVSVNQAGNVPVAVQPGAFTFAPGSTTSGTSETTIVLIAQAATNGGTRVYTISGTLKDAAGNATPFSVTVLVARNR